MKILKEYENGVDYVYFIFFKDGYTKIGRTNNFKKRLKDIERSNQIKHEDYFLIKGKNNTEKFFHKYYKEKRRYSEFFKLDFYQVKEYISTLNLEIIENYKTCKTCKTCNTESLVYIKIGDNKIELEKAINMVKKETKTDIKFIKQTIEMLGEIKAEERITGKVSTATLIKADILNNHYEDFLRTCKFKESDNIIFT